MQRRWPTCPGITPRWAGCHPHAYRITISRTTHPRVGGENYASRRTAGSPYGSSPHGRGKLGLEDGGGLLYRLIPAWAGKTTRFSRFARSIRAHPRAGGENARAHLPGRCAQGLIPARAGKTKSSSRSSDLERAHPRAGGENKSCEGSGSQAFGSSPRGRGKPGGPTCQAETCRLIPARAGKTSTTCNPLWHPRAHPRAGGENSDALLSLASIIGSSPRGRGKHFLTCAFIERIGQILETLELAVSSGSYSLCDVYATDAPRDPARSIGLVPLSNRDASSESVLRSRRASRDLPTSGKRGPARCAHDRPSRHVLSSCSP